MNLDVNRPAVKLSLTVGFGLVALSFVGQVVMQLVADNSQFYDGALYISIYATFSFLLWVGALAALPGLVALGVAAARPSR